MCEVNCVFVLGWWWVDGERCNLSKLSTQQHKQQTDEISFGLSKPHIQVFEMSYAVWISQCSL